MKLTTLILVILFISQSVSAQSNWTSVQNLASGSRVRVDVRTGGGSKGDVAAVTDVSLTVRDSSGQNRVIARDDVKRVFLVEPGSGSRGKKIAIWSAVGLGIGAAIGAALLGATGGSDETGKVLAPFLIGGAAGGAAIGASMSRGNKETLIYESR